MSTITKKIIKKPTKKVVKKATSKKKTVAKKTAAPKKPVVKKTVAKKVVVKKTVAKKNPIKKTAKEIALTKKVADDNVFFLIDGSTISTLKELADAYNRMGDDIFYYHVTDDRNDFSAWVNEIFNLKDLAEKLNESRNPMQSQITLLRYLLDW